MSTSGAEGADGDVSRGRLAPVAARILMKILYGVRSARLDLLRAVSHLVCYFTKWTSMCDKRLHQLVCYINSTLHHRMVGWIGDELGALQPHLFADADFAGDRGGAVPGHAEAEAEREAWKDEQVVRMTELALPDVNQRSTFRTVCASSSNCKSMGRCFKSVVSVPRGPLTTTTRARTSQVTPSGPAQAVRSAQARQVQEKWHCQDSWTGGRGVRRCRVCGRGSLRPTRG